MINAHIIIKKKIKLHDGSWKQEIRIWDEKFILNWINAQAIGHYREEKEVTKGQIKLQITFQVQNQKLVLLLGIILDLIKIIVEPQNLQKNQV